MRVRFVEKLLTRSATTGSRGASRQGKFLPKIPLDCRKWRFRASLLHAQNKKIDTQNSSGGRLGGDELSWEGVRSPTPPVATPLATDEAQNLNLRAETCLVKGATPIVAVLQSICGL